MSTVPELADETQVRFDPPTDDWRKYVATLDALALDVYLIDLRQNRSLRTTEHPPPIRLDLHYLITAWSPAAPSQAVEPTADEHALLYAAATALILAAPLVPAKIYDELPVGFPAVLADATLSTTVLPAEGFPKYAEFWGTMAGAHPWRPALYLTVTVPVAAGVEFTGPLVTTRVTTVGGEAEIQIGGTITDTAGSPVAGAWVRLGDHVARSDGQGRYTFLRLPSATYRLRVRAAGFAEASRDIEVPNATGYDVTISHLG
jgi:hypothetical protein